MQIIYNINMKNIQAATTNVGKSRLEFFVWQYHLIH